MQYHFVGLDKQNITNSNNSADLPTTSNSMQNSDDLPSSQLDDATIEQGDEHTRQITGGPQTSMMSIDNPETFAGVVCVAPAEGQKPLSIMTDSNFEAMSNPDKFPIRNGCFSTEKPHKLTYRNSLM